MTNEEGQEYYSETMPMPKAMTDITLNEIRQAIRKIVEVGRAPKSATMHNLTWVMLSHSPEIVNTAIEIPSPSKLTLLGLSVSFDNTMPIGKIEYEWTQP